MSHKHNNKDNKNYEIKQQQFTQHLAGENLNLSRQGFTDNDIQALIHFLVQNPHVKKLDLSLNNIGDQGVADFAERNHTILQVNFSGNNISDRGLAVFASKNQTVLQVDFSHNPISDQGISNFAQKNQTCYMSYFSTFQYH